MEQAIVVIDIVNIWYKFGSVLAQKRRSGNSKRMKEITNTPVVFVVGLTSNTGKVGFVDA